MYQKNTSAAALLKFGAAFLKFGEAFLKFGEAFLKFGEAFLKFGEAFLKFGAYKSDYKNSDWLSKRLVSPHNGGSIKGPSLNPLIG